jgi:predicted ATP-dependent endonuclease of OLD family
VSNKAVDYDDVSDSDVTLRRQHTDVKAERYRTFVGRNPDKVTYFQPVLDKLSVAPSRLDLVRPSVLLEGKADYLILEYGRRVLLKVENSFAAVPTRGAAGMDELVGLFRGWGVPFALCLDADKAGKQAAQKYRTSWALPGRQVLTLADVCTTLDGKAIEGVLQKSDLELVATHFGVAAPPTKGQVQLFFSEMLARRALAPLSEQYRSTIEKFEERIGAALA